MGDLASAVADLQAAYEESNELSARVLDHLERIAKRLAEVPTAEQVDQTARVVRRRANKLVGALAVVILVLACVGYSFRVQELRRERDAVAARRQEAAATRSVLIAGCQRGNDQRLTFGQFIIIEHPDDKAQRDRLLALPGVQPVDCEAAYPPLPGETNPRSTP